MIEQLKHTIDYLSAPTISFTLLTVIFPFVFPPTDWFDKVSKKFGIWRIWTNTGGFILFILTTAFFYLGFNDENFSIVLTKPDNFPIIMMIYTMFFYTWYGMKKSYINDRRIERGEIKVNEEIEIVGIRDTQKTVCTGVEMFRKLLDEGKAGENVGILLRGTQRDEVERGQVLTKPGAINPHTKFEATVYVLSKEEGGRHTPFFKGYRPQFYVRTTDVTGAVELPEGVEMVMPGDNIDMTVELISPVAMEDGMKFAIREGGRTVGSGVVTKIIE